MYRCTYIYKNTSVLYKLTYVRSSIAAGLLDLSRLEILERYSSSIRLTYMRVTANQNLVAKDEMAMSKRCCPARRSTFRIKLQRMQSADDVTLLHMLTTASMLAYRRSVPRPCLANANWTSVTEYRYRKKSAH